MRNIIKKSLLLLLIVQEKTDKQGIKRHKLTVWNPLSYITLIILVLGIFIYSGIEEVIKTIDYNPFKWS